MPSPIRLGLIGYGAIAKLAHRPGILASADVVKVTAAADVAPDNLEAAHADYGVPRDQLYSDYRDMLARAEIDAVDIATPHNLHAEQAIEAANAGKAVVCEKPMAVSSEEGDAIVEAVKRNGVPYSMGQMFLFSPAVTRAKELLADPAMGEPFIGRTQSMFRRAAPRDAASQGPPQWSRSQAGGGGCLNITTNHEIYVLEDLMGSPIRWVEGRVRTLHQPIEVDDTAILLCEHESGAVSVVSSSWTAKSGPNDSGRFAEAQAAGGGVRAYFTLGPAHLYHLTAEDMEWHQVEVDPDYEEDTSADAIDYLESRPVGSLDHTGHSQFIRATYSALARGERPPLSLELARHNLAIMEAAREATLTRRAVEVM